MLLPCWLWYIPLLFTAPVTCVRHFKQISVCLKDLFWGFDPIKYFIIVSNFLSHKTYNRFKTYASILIYYVSKYNILICFSNIKTPLSVNFCPSKHWWNLFSSWSCLFRYPHSFPGPPEHSQRTLGSAKTNTGSGIC